MMADLWVSVFVVVGASFALIGSFGLARLPDFYSRLHGPTKATTLGVGALLIASVIHFSTQGTGLSFHELLVTLFLFMTAPVSAHLLVRAALHRKVESRTRDPHANRSDSSSEHTFARSGTAAEPVKREVGGRPGGPL